MKVYQYTMDIVDDPGEKQSTVSTVLTTCVQRWSAQ